MFTFPSKKANLLFADVPVTLGFCKKLTAAATLLSRSGEVEDCSKDKLNITSKIVKFSKSCLNMFSLCIVLLFLTFAVAACPGIVGTIVAEVAGVVVPGIVGVGNVDIVFIQMKNQQKINQKSKNNQKQ